MKKYIYRAKGRGMNIDLHAKQGAGMSCVALILEGLLCVPLGHTRLHHVGCTDRGT